MIRRPEAIQYIEGMKATFSSPNFQHSYMQRNNGERQQRILALAHEIGYALQDDLDHALIAAELYNALLDAQPLARIVSLPSFLYLVRLGRR